MTNMEKMKDGFKWETLLMADSESMKHYLRNEKVTSLDPHKVVWLGELGGTLTPSSCHSPGYTGVLQL